jgi:GDP-L-fucose synthase
MNRVNKTDVILITGAGGGLGAAMKAEFLKNGYLNLLTPVRKELDLLSKESVDNYFLKYKPNAVFHLASLVFGLLGNLENQFKSVIENTVINNNLMEAISNHEIKYVFFAGTVASYPYPYKSMPLSENDFFNGLPHSGEFGYAMAKRHAYSYLKILNECNNLNFTYGIYTNLYGEWDKFNSHSGHVIPSLVAKGFMAAKSGKSLEVWGDGSAIRDFMHFNDAARASLHAMEEGLFGLLNISSGERTTIADVATEICNKYSVNIKYLKDKPVGIPLRYVNNEKLRLSGFNQKTQISDGLSALCEWYSKNVEIVRK